MFKKTEERNMKMEFSSGELGNEDIGVEKKETILDGKQWDWY